MGEWWGYNSRKEADQYVVSLLCYGAVGLFEEKRSHLLESASPGEELVSGARGYV